MKKAMTILAGALAAVGMASGFALGSAPISEPASSPAAAAEHLYITGDGDFAGGRWTAMDPDEFELVDGNFVITVDNLSQFKISTTYGDWDTFNEGALCCEYGTVPGAVVDLEPGDTNIMCPAMGNWTITVAGDLSTIKLTSDEPVVVVPIEDEPLYVRGDMNNWDASDEWQLTRLGKDSNGAWVYSYVCGESGINYGESFKIAEANWAKINIGGDGETVMLDTETEVFNGGNPANLMLEEDFSGVFYLQMDYSTNFGYIYFSNDKDAACPFAYEGYEPSIEPAVLHMYINGEEVANGSRVDISSFYEDEEYQYMIDPKMEIKADESGAFSGVVKLTQGATVPEFDWDFGATVNALWCALDGRCVPLSVGQSATKSASLAANKAEDMQLEISGMYGDYQNPAELAIKAECTFNATFGGKEYSLTLFVDHQPSSGSVTPEPEPKPDPVGSPIENIEDLCGIYSVSEDWWWPLTSDPLATPTFTISHLDGDVIEISCSWITWANPIKAKVNREAGTITITTEDNADLCDDPGVKLALMDIDYDNGGTLNSVSKITVPVNSEGQIDFYDKVILWADSEDRGYYCGIGVFNLTKQNVAEPNLYICTLDEENEPYEVYAFRIEDDKYVITLNDLSAFRLSTKIGDEDQFDEGGLTCDYGSVPGVDVALSPGIDPIICPFTGEWTITISGDLSTITLTADEPVVIVPIEDEPIYLRGSMNEWGVSEEWQLTRLGKDEEGAWIYTYKCGETGILAGEEFKIADKTWSKVNIGAVYDTEAFLNSDLPMANGGNPSNISMMEDFNGVLYLCMNYDLSEGYIYLSNDKEEACPYPYEGYDPSTPVPAVEHLYITGDGDFINGSWDPVTPAEFEFVDGKYVITVDNLSTLKISTACGAWDIFNEGALYCNYGMEPGVKVPLVRGDENILCPVKATWTVTVAADLSTVMLTTDDPIVIIPIEEIPIYVRGDMNGWGVSDEWKMTLLGKDTDGAAVYAYTFGDASSIAAGNSFKIAEENWSKINIGTFEDILVSEVVSEAVNNGNPQNFVAEEEISGVLYLQMNYATNEGAIYVSNDKSTPCPFDYVGRPEPGVAKVNVAVSDGAAFGYNVKFGETAQFTVSLADKYWKLVSYTQNGDKYEIPTPGASYVCSFTARMTNDFVFTAEYAGTLEVIETSGMVELGNKVTISVEDSTVVIRGLEVGTPVAIYTLGGQVILSRAAADEEMHITLDKGNTYIVRAGEAAVKVIL